MDFAWDYGYANPSCTSQPCAWNTAGSSKMVVPMRLEDLKWKKPSVLGKSTSSNTESVFKQTFKPNQKGKNDGMSFDDFK